MKEQAMEEAKEDYERKLKLIEENSILQVATTDKKIKERQKKIE